MKKLFHKPTSFLKLHNNSCASSSISTTCTSSIINSLNTIGISRRQFHHGRILFNNNHQQDETSSSTEEDQTQFRFLQRGLKFASPKLIILLGPPGSGKGTQSRFITGENPSYHIISAGDTLREESQTNQQLKELLASGKLAPEDETAKFLLKKMNNIYKEYYEQVLLKESENVVTTQSSEESTQSTAATSTTEEQVAATATAAEELSTTTTNEVVDNSSSSTTVENSIPPPNFILEGYPRNIVQCKQFLTWFTGGDIHFSKPNTIILHLLVDKECIKERLRGRLIHDKSGRTYHVEFRKPETDEKDDITGDDLTIREDDKKDEAVVNRMTTYKSHTLPTLELLIDNEFEIVDVPAIEQNVEKVRSKVKRILIENGYIAKPIIVTPTSSTTAAAAATVVVEQVDGTTATQSS